MSPTNPDGEVFYVFGDDLTPEKTTAGATAPGVHAPEAQARFPSRQAGGKLLEGG
jgi:hypothetical protein